MKQKDSVSHHMKPYDDFEKQEGNHLMQNSRESKSKTVLKGHGLYETK